MEKEELTSISPFDNLPHVKLKKFHVGEKIGGAKC
jgi:hypothetical protein